MHRYSTAVLALSALAVAACQPQKTPEQLAAEQAAAALQGMASAFGGMAGQTTVNGQPVDPAQMAAAMAQAGAMAGALNPDMTPEERAKMQAITGAIASGQVHPAASAYVAGLDKVFTIISGIKDVAGADAAKPKVAAIYAEMAGPAATLKAMTQDQRDVAFGSAYVQFASFGMKTAGIMMPLMNNPELGEKISDLLEGIPQPE